MRFEKESTMEVAKTLPSGRLSPKDRKKVSFYREFMQD
jgi:hypothetical protein